MAWPRIKNSRSSAQPGTQPHNGVQATVTPEPDAEPPRGSEPRGSEQSDSEQNLGVSGTTLALAYDYDGGQGDPALAATGSRAGRRLRPIRYAHSAGDQAPGDQAPGPAPQRTAGSANGLPPVVPVLSNTGLSGTVLPGQEAADDEADDHGGTAGLVDETPPSASGEPPAEPPAGAAAPVPNDGLEIFGGVATTEVPVGEVPTREFESQPPAPPVPGPVIAIGQTFNERHGPPPEASSATEDRKPNPFSWIRRVLGTRLGGGQPTDDGVPRVNVRDLPPDVQLRFIRDRVIIALVVGVASYVLWRNWPVSVTLLIVAWVLDMLRRQRTAQLYVNGGPHPGARKATTKQLRRLRHDGYYTLDARPIPGSREAIDHLVIGPTGVYAIDSEKWNPKVPVRTFNGKKLYYGPESQKDRLEHAVWEASQASEVLSSALGYEVKVRPALAIYGPKIPWNVATIRNVDVFTGTTLGRYLRQRGRMKAGVTRLNREEIKAIYDAAAKVLPDVAQTYTPVGS